MNEGALGGRSDALALAALNQALLRMLCRLKENNLRWRQYDRFLIGENRWRAQRYGVREGLIDFGDRSIKPMTTLLEELEQMLAEDMDILGTATDIARLKKIATSGTSARRQRQVHADAVTTGKDPGRAVVQHLIEEFHADL